MLDALESCCEEVQQAPSSRVLSIHSAPSFAAKWLAPRLPDFSARYPDITLRLTTGAEPVDLIQAREIDVAITFGHAPEPPGVAVLPLGEERIVPMCSPALKPRRMPWRQCIATLPLIDSQLGQVSWRDWFVLNELVLPDRPRQSFDRGALSISAAADQLGVALETTRFAERELARGDLVEVGPTVFKSFHRVVHFLSVRSNEGHVERIRRFRDWLLAATGARA